jgi:regulator of cell morphogenesis and NO signaling
MNATPDTTIREVVAADYRAAAIFERYGLDFCCNGCRTIEQGCRDAGADEEALIRELGETLGTPAAGVPRFASWDARTLIAYIVANHHSYVRQALPALRQHTTKVAEVHGDRHPELKHIARLFGRVADEMADHMVKEEQVLFPFIAALEDARAVGARKPSAPFGTVANPIHMMESEHEFVGDAMAEIRHLTGGYALPPDACATYTVCFEELAAFERDLHDHVHLENNLLFPKAAALESGSPERL